MDIVRQIIGCRTFAELATSESLYVLKEYEQSLIYERKIDIISVEQNINRQELSTDLFSTSTPEQVQEFLGDWNNDNPFQQLVLSVATEHKPMLQHGRGEKRIIDDVYDGARTSDQVNENQYFTMTKERQIQVKKFNPTGSDYTVELRDAFSDLDIVQFHERIPDMFESLLNTILQGISQHDQVRLVLRSQKLDHPIALSFMRFLLTRVFCNL